MPTQRIELDVSNALTAAASYANRILGMNVATADLIVTQQQYNKNAGGYITTIERQIDANRKLQIQITQTANATAAASKVITAAPKTSIANAPTTANAATRTATEQGLKSLFPAPSNATISQLASYQNAISKIGNLVGSGKITGQRVQELLGNLQGPNKGQLTNLSAVDRQVTSALAAIGKEFRNAEKDAQSFGLTTRNALRIAEAFVLKDAIGAIANQLKLAGLQAVQFQIKISQIRTISQNNQASFNGWADSIKRVSDEFGLGNLDVAEAAYQAISNQVTAGQEQTEAFLKTTANFARVGVGTLADATELTSSAINAYGFSLSRTEEIQAKFFKAIELGRFKMSDLANSFGRVAAPGAAVGVRFEETAAAIATITRQGVTPADAQTQLLNLFNSLSKPGEKLQQVIKGMGVESAQAAIATFGFTDFLKKLEDQAQGNIAVISELGGDLRAIRAIIGLTTRGFGDQFRKDLADVENAGVSFRNAINIRGESGGDQLIKEFTKIKNFFVIDIGQKAVNALADFDKRFVSIVTVAKVFGKSLFALTAAFVVHKTAVVSLSAAQAIYSAGTVRAAASTSIFAAGMSTASRTAFSLKVALLSLPWVQIISLATLAGVAIYETFKRTKTETEDFKNRVDELNAKAGKAEAPKQSVVEKFQKDALKEQDNLNKDINVTFAARLKLLADQSIKNQEVLSKLKTQGRDLADTLKASFGTVSEAIGKAINAYTENIQRAKRGIDEVNRSIRSTSETTDEIVNSIKNQFASEDQKFALRDQQIQQLIARAQQVATAGGPNAAQEVESLKKEIANLLREDEIARKQRGVDIVKAQRQGDLASGRITEAQANAPIQVDAEQSRQRIVDTFSVVDSILLRVKKQKEEEIDANQKLLTIALEQKKVNELRAKDLEKVTPFNETGDDISRDFKDGNGRFDAAKFRNSRKQAENNFLGTLTPPKLTGDTEADREAKKVFDDAVVSFKKVFEAQRALLDQEIKVLEEKNRIANEQSKVGQDQQEAIKGAEKATQNRVTAREDILKANTKIAADVEGLQRNINSFRPGVAEFFTAPRDDFDERKKIGNKNKGDLERAERLLAVIDSVSKQSVGADGKVNFDKDREALVRSAITQVKAIFDQVYSQKTGQLDSSGVASGDDLFIGQRIAGLQEQVDKLAAANNLEQQALGTLQGVNSSIQTQTGVNREQLQALRYMTAVMINGDEKLLQAALQAGIATKIPGFASGGLIKGPWSSGDNILIAAQSEEMMMKRSAVKKFYPQLAAMNADLNPNFGGSFSQGGVVSNTNVGDVHVTINTPVSPKENVLAIGKGLQRAIRQGSLGEFNKKK